jgi:DNA-binding transcriptional regulator LsrR (DeoR family)
MDRVSRAERRRLAGLEVVGDVVGYLVTIDGELIDDPWSDHTIAAPIADLRRAARLIAIAAGPHKVAGIIGASRSGLVHTLVTDEPTASAVIERLERAAPVRRGSRRRRTRTAPVSAG